MSENKGNVELTEEEQQKLMEKYDAESNTRKLTGVAGWIVFFTLIAFSLFQLYTGAFGAYTAYIQRTVHLGFALALIFLLFPARRGTKKNTVAWYDWILVILSIVVTAYWPVFYDMLVQQIGGIELVQVIIGGLAILLVLEAARRAVGLPIVIIAVVFLLYAIFGPQMPGMLAHRGLSLEQLVDTMFFTTEGILGTPLQVSSTYIFLFLLFGAFLVQTGVGLYFNDLALAIAGRRVGGPAKVAIFSSALNGTISGSSVANTVTTGAYTIPMMKRLGYRPNFAGAVEAASSTGGQIMPPIMGAAAFLMIEFAGVPYWEIAKAAVIPAILYFSGIWIMTHLEAKRVGLLGLPKEEIPNKKEVFKKLYLLLPILAIVYLLFAGYSIERTAIYGILITIGVSLLRKDTNMFLENNKFTLRKLIDALTSGARTALGVAAATASAGIIVGVVTKTGLGLKLGNGLVDMAAGIANSPQTLLLLTLFFTMVTSIILGMGSPTTANYIITSTIALPAIMALVDQHEFAIPVLAAHMFVFYFGIVADITPPVALAAFAASGISGGEPIRTGFNASKLAIAAFIIPYMFVLEPQLLMIDVTAGGMIWILITAITGMIAIGAGLIGFWYRKLHWIERIITVVTGLLLMYPEGNSDFIGLGLFVVLVIIQFMSRTDKPTKGKTQQANA
ncbi:TRAP transporter permease [Oceanobacillus bengalensis]|uniref:TRAP transporter permease n=1 Tax=Oceanobacillus bengalensis TaxID=1435466 RepID=A0A494Z1J4_9BACI|nr:TRAP transporter permease [Oceanobacillus bengalensis]RKQ15859.1 TRAP transporter permease [Oceanobacillus bengalensis]